MANIIEQSNGVKKVTIQTPYEGVNASINALTQTVAGKADKTDLNGKANQSDLDTTNAKLADIATFPQRLNGETDDSPSIQRAIDNGATIILLPSTVTLNSPINATNRADKPLKFIGQGWSEYGGAGTVVNANTGGVAFDTTGSQYITFEDMLIYSSSSMPNPSTIGILVARSTTSQYAQFHNYKRLYIYLASNPSATGRGSIGILNISGEHMNYDHGFIIADLPLALMATNVLGVTSPFVTIGTLASMTLCSFKQVGMRAYTQSALEMWNAQNISFDKCYFSIVPGNTTNQAIALQSNCSDIQITGQMEQFNRALQLNYDCTNIELNVFMASASLAYVYLSPGIKVYNPKFCIHQANGTLQQIINAADPNINIYGGEITVLNGQGLNSPNLTMMGTNVNAVNVSNSSIVLSATSNYTINQSPIKAVQTGTNGYIQYLNGLTEQWMKVTYNVTAGTDMVINLPTSFVNSCDNVQVSPIGTSGTTATNNGSTKSTVTVRCSTQSVDLFIRAVGH